jgi:hypothetical protein
MWHHALDSGDCPSASVDIPFPTPSIGKIKQNHSIVVVFISKKSFGEVPCSGM